MARRSLHSEGNGSDIREEHVFPLSDATDAITQFKARLDGATEVERRRDREHGDANGRMRPVFHSTEGWL